ncbi:MAG: hydroxylamine reductase [Clostridia bacterium]|nr:hydroxylamine reductase [Clostridia bacterium]
MELKDYRELLDIATKGLCAVTTEMRVELQEVPKSVDRMVVENLVLTSDDICLDPVLLSRRIDETFAQKKTLMETLKATRILTPAAQWCPEDASEYEEKLSAIRAEDHDNIDAHSLRVLITRGLKGVAQIADMAYRIGFEDEGIDPFLQRVLQRTLKFNLSIGLLFNLSMEVGGFGYRAMGLLDKALIDRYGTPSLTNVELGVRKNPGILVAGQDLRVLECVLQATDGQGVDVYTYGELLSAHAYENLRSVDHFAGQYGDSPENQTADFADFHGPVIFAGSGVKAPEESFRDRFYTAGLTFVPEVRNFQPDEDLWYDFTEVVEQAKACEPPKDKRIGEQIIGFGHDQLNTMGERILGSLNDHSIDRLIAILGTDSADPRETYFADLAAELPKNSAILTAGSVQSRLATLGLGTVRGIPRVLTVGQLPDQYSICMFAMKLQADLEKYDLNGVPVSFVLSISDERSLLSLLVLLYVGAKKIVIGPAIPNFLTENIFGIFEKNFGLTAAGTPSEDAKAFFEKTENTDGTIDTNMLIIDILDKYPEAATILMNVGMSCVTCGSALYESLAEACMVHGLDPEDIKEVLDHELGLVEDDE